MEFGFYLSSAVAVIATLLVIVQLNPVHALLYLIVSLLAVAMVFFTLGAPYAAVLEVLVYAGAIMVLFIFVVMMLNLGEETVAQERVWMKPATWIGPSLLSLVLLGELAYLLLSVPVRPTAGTEIGAKEVGMALFGPYLLAVELSSMLLTAGLVGAWHLGRREPGESHRRGT
jgi:NADH-quinone oxidoreductase subunit J